MRGWKLDVFNQLHKKYQSRFSWFPFIMMICYFLSSIRRIIQAFTAHDGGFGLTIAMYILMPLQGLFNTIVYGMFEECVRVRIRAFMRCDWEEIQRLDNLENEAYMLHQQEQID